MASWLIQHIFSLPLLMCGICGEFLFDPAKVASEERLRAMQATIIHRGPNDEGHFIQGPCALGFRRLSIIDLGGGHQPIANEDETVWVTLNGEIYNYPELRLQLEQRGHQFRTRSDTEVIVHLYEEHGLDFCSFLRGMFGIALYDTRQQRLVLARDRLGIKPVYYWQNANQLVYGSEIKALLAHPEVTAEPNEAAIFEFLWLRSSITPGTMFKNISKLPAGTMLVASAKGVEVKTWWRLQVPEVQCENLEDAVPRYEAALGDAVECHLLSDVPVGVFLSGGLDSSVLTSMIQERSAKPVTCFTAGFSGDRDESHWAALVAKHLGVRHEILPIQPPAPELLEEMLWHLDEPVADPACMPTFLLSREASRQVRVVLTGEGSDETNLGYAKFLRYHLFSSMPAFFSMAKLFWPLLRRIGPAKTRLDHYAPLWSAEPGLARLLANDGFSLEPTATSPESLAPRLGRHRAAAIAKVESRLRDCGGTGPMQQLLCYVRTGFMEEGLLMKLDRMTMAHGLEARVPFLDHHLVELNAGISPAVRLNERRTKAVLRAIAEKRLPAVVAARRQHGFIVPLDQWFGGSFATWVASILSPENIKRREMFDVDMVSSLLRQYRDSGSHARIIWSLVLLELWFRRFID